MVAITRSTGQLVLRIVEAVLCFVLLATCSHVSNQLGPQFTQYFGGIGLGIFTGLFGLLTAALYIATPFIKADSVHADRLRKVLPGVGEVAAAGVWCLFSLCAAGAAASGLAAYGICSGTYSGRLFPAWRFLMEAAPAGAGGAGSPGGGRALLQAYGYSSGLCAAWGLAITSGFLLFFAWGASAVLAGFDMRDGLGLWPLNKPDANKAAAEPAADAAGAAGATTTGGPKEAAAAAAAADSA